MEGISTQLVYGFLDAGKTAYIQDSIFHGFFHRRGSTLVLCFEEGETAYDTEKLRDYRTVVAFWDGDEDITAFCCDAVRREHPDRVFVEINTMVPGLREKLPDVLAVGVSAMLIDGSTLELYARNMRQLLQDMVKASNQVTINRCPDKLLLQPYGRLFQLMNRNAVFLWEGPGGYHERAFDGLVPYDADQAQIDIGEGDLIPFALDAAANPDRYKGKLVSLDAQVSETGDGDLKIGRIVMTCCMADLQFMGVVCAGVDRTAYPPGSWVRLKAKGETASDRYGRKYLVLRAAEVNTITPPESIILNA